MADISSLDTFDDQVAALESTLQGASGMAAAFNGELDRMGATIDELSTDVGKLSSGFSSGLKRALDDLVLDSGSLTDALKTVRDSIIKTAYDTAVTPVTDHVGGLLAQAVGSAMNAFLPFARGAGFSQGRVMPFAQGGVVTGATTFAMRGGTGLMGEAGPEAVLPLARGPGGKLGVSANGSARPINVTMNVTTPDVESFRRSQGQIAAQVSRALSRGKRYS
jgi:phage-related minor tail protein